MGATNRIFAALAVLLVLALASCSGGAGLTGSDALDNAAAGNGGSELLSASIELDTNTSDNGSDFGELPPIPLDTEADIEKSSSAVSVTSVNGADYLAKWNSIEDGDSLIIGVGDQPEGRERLAYGLYRFTGLQGQRPLSLNIEATPAMLGNQYFIGVADYTLGRWKFFEPSALPEYELDLTQTDNQLVTKLGSMYFLVVTWGESTVTHIQSSVITGEPGPGQQPGCPHHLVASDGQFANAVRLDWLGGAGAEGYQIWRKPVADDGEWHPIGNTQETNYLDVPLPDWQMFWYRVRAVNANGESCWSNIDTGFGGGGLDPCIVNGAITTWNGDPVAGVAVGLVGMGEEMVRRTNEEGFFSFRDLAPGKYIVAPHNPELSFNPRYQVVDLAAECVEEVFFNAAPEAVFHRSGGFVFTKNPESDNAGIIPLEGVPVVLQNVQDEGDKRVVQTNADGFYLFTDIPNGIYIVTPIGGEHFNFLPGPQQVLVNGTNRPDLNFFHGVPKAGDPGDPGDPQGGGA